MTTTPGDVVLPVAQTSGSGVDTLTFTSTYTGNPTVNRQVVALGSPSTFGNVAEVSLAGNLLVQIAAPLPSGERDLERETRSYGRLLEASGRYGER